MKLTPKISIIIPVYNVEKYMNECINSVLSQSFQDIEIILINDGSKDSSGEICNNYKATDPRIHVIHKKNGGASSARNAGIKFSNGKYLMFLDSDDYWNSESLLSNLIESIEKYNPDILMFGYTLYSEYTKKYGPQIYNFDTALVNNAPFEKAFKYLVSSANYSVHAGLKLIRASIIKENKILFKEGIVGEDIDWMANLILHTESVAAINEHSYIYRRRPGSVTNTMTYKNYNDLYRIIKKWTNYINQIEVNAKFKYYYLGYFTFQYYILMGLTWNLKGKTRQEHLRKIKKLKWLTKYSVNNKTKKARLIYKIFGFHISCFILNLYINKWR